MLAAIFTLPDVASVVIVGIPLFLKPALIAGVGIPAYAIHVSSSNLKCVTRHPGMA